jgi:hypothetical protein
MIDNTDYTSLLGKIAEELTSLAAKPEALRAILLQGSVAKGIADAYSDIELTFIWATTTTAEDRAAIFQDTQKELLFAEEEEDGEWVSTFMYKSVKVDILHLEMPTLQSIIQGVMESRVTSIASQTLLASIQDSIALYGKAALDEINGQIAHYPLELSTRCIKVNASFSEWSMRDALLERKDMVAFHHLVDLILLQMLRLLYALNQTYLRSYNFKWFRYGSSKLALKPEDFENRVEALLSGSGTKTVDDLDTLLHEVFDLVQKQRPDIDMSQALATLGYLRQKLEIENF